MGYGCKAAKSTDEHHGWECDISGGACMFLVPSSASCAQMYGEGPDASETDELTIKAMEKIPVVVPKRDKDGKALLQREEFEDW